MVPAGHLPFLGEILRARVSAVRARSDSDYDARLRDGSLRSAARERGARVLLYEAGEAWRLDEWAITAGVDGVLRVLTMLGMIIGVGAVITMVALGKGAQVTIEEQVKAAGTNMITVMSGNFSQGGVRQGTGMTIGHRGEERTAGVLRVLQQTFKLKCTADELGPWGSG